MYKTVIVLTDAMRQRGPQAMNATAHLAQSIGAQCQGAQGARFVDYRDKDGVEFPSISWWPVILLSGRRGKIWTFWEELTARGWTRTAFFESMFDGGSAVQMERTADLDRETLELVAVAAFGPADEISALSKSFSLWRG